MLIKKKQNKVSPYYYHKNYYAFKFGEAVGATPAGSVEQAVKELNKLGYTLKDYDQLLEYDKKMDSYVLINLNLKNYKTKSATSKVGKVTSD